MDGAPLSKSTPPAAPTRPGLLPLTPPLLTTHPLQSTQQGMKRPLYPQAFLLRSPVGSAPVNSHTYRPPTSKRPRRLAISSRGHKGRTRSKGKRELQGKPPGRMGIGRHSGQRGLLQSPFLLQQRFRSLGFRHPRMTGSLAPQEKPSQEIPKLIRLNGFKLRVSRW